MPRKSQKTKVQKGKKLMIINQLPDFTITPDSIVPRLEELLAEGRALLARIETVGTPTWSTIGEPMDAHSHKIGAYWSPISHLNSVMKTEAFEKAHNEAQQLLSAYGTEIMQSEKLYALYTELAASDEFAAYSPARKKSVQNYLRNAKLSGVGLPSEQKKRYAEIQERLTVICEQFETHVLKAMGAWKKHVTEKKQVSGIPEDTLANAKAAAEKDGKEGWIFSLDGPTYVAVLSFADDRELRQEFHLGWATRASDCGPSAGEFDNTKLMEEILALRHEEAQLIDPNRYANYADLSVETKMVSSAEAVMKFLNDLNVRAHHAAHQDMEELRMFAEAKFAVTSLAPWDLAYYSEKLREEKYAISEKELKQYFPLERVLAGMFGVVHKLYGMSVSMRSDVLTWHSDVRFYEIHDKDGVLRGQFYLDPYARSGTKRGGAWMDVCVSRMRTKEGSVHVPVAYLTCNSTQPVDGKPGLLSHDEAITVFHEFGHGLHHMLTLVDELDVSGISGVEWDAVELPSQFMENFCFDWDTLESMTAHAETGLSLPRDMFDKMIAAKNFQSALGFVRQIEFSLFDFRLHREYDPQKGARVLEILNDVRSRVRVVPVMSDDRMPWSFTHIFSGGYAAGYFSYKWAEVLSADAYAQFEEKGIFDPETGASFLHNILEVGGSRPMAESFRAFRGREPNITALLRHSGLISEK
jgi:oligopeptidase A